VFDGEEHCAILVLGELDAGVVTTAADFGAGLPCDMDPSTYAWPWLSLVAEGSDVYFVVTARECTTGRL
jgi:hypothetical protein